MTKLRAEFHVIHKVKFSSLISQLYQKSHSVTNLQKKLYEFLIKKAFDLSYLPKKPFSSLKTITCLKTRFLSISKKNIKYR